MSDPIAAFVRDTNDLVSSIQHYKPNVTSANAIIHDQDKIGEEISKLRQTSKTYRDYDTSLQVYNTQLTNGLKECLMDLVDCKKSLDKQPKQASIAPSDDLNEQDTTTILSYALKLSKFSKIPRTFEGFLLPNNFIWPGDDNMRRGNLAIASMMPEKIINTENYGPNYVAPVETADTEFQDEKDDKRMDEDESDDDFISQRSTSMTETAKNNSVNAVMTGLDLLDSDDE